MFFTMNPNLNCFFFLGGGGRIWGGRIGGRTDEQTQTRPFNFFEVEGIKMHK